MIERGATLGMQLLEMSRRPDWQTTARLIKFYDYSIFVTISIEFCYDKLLPMPLPLFSVVCQPNTTEATSRVFCGGADRGTPISHLKQPVASSMWPIDQQF